MYVGDSQSSLVILEGGARKGGASFRLFSRPATGRRDSAATVVWPRRPINLGPGDEVSNGVLFIADTGNNLIREVTPGDGLIKTVAGDGTEGFSGNGGPATKARLNGPEGVRCRR